MDKRSKVTKIFGFGVVSQAITLILGIVIPKLLIVNYGSEINGLLSSVRQIFVYVALLEAGIGTAALQAMYAPTAKGDKQRASEIMAATDRYYKRTGILYGIAIIALAVVYPFVVKTNIDCSIIIVVIILQGASGVINYFFQGKFVILLRVDGKSYITTNANTIVSVAAKLTQIILILLGFNVVAVQFAHFAINLLQIIYITIYVKKHYSWLDLKVKPDYKALSQSKNVIIHQISGLIFNNTDIVILTFFCGLTQVSIYSLYSLIVSCVSNIIDTVCSSVEFVLGQAFNSDRKRFIKLQEVYETYYLCISFTLFTITLLMLPSFINIYSTGITDGNYIDTYLPYLFVSLNVLVYARRTSSQIINFAGHFQQTQWRSVLESAINLSVSLILVQKIGIYGVLIGTIAALLYRTNDIIIYANIHILNRSPRRTYRRWGCNLGIMLFCFFIFRSLIPSINNYYQWVITSLWVSLCCIIVFFFTDSLADRQSFFYVVDIIKSHRIK